MSASGKEGKAGAGASHVEPLLKCENSSDPVGLTRSGKEEMWNLQRSPGENKVS